MKYILFMKINYITTLYRLNCSCLKQYINQQSFWEMMGKNTFLNRYSDGECISGRFGEWVSDWVPGWLSKWLSEWLIDRLIKWVRQRKIYRERGCVSERYIVWVSEWRSVWAKEWVRERVKERASGQSGHWVSEIKYNVLEML